MSFSVNTMMRRLVLIGSAALFGSGVVAFGLLGHTPVSASSTNTVTVEKVGNIYEFVPSQLTVKAGSTVTWKNASTAPHTVTSDTPGLLNRNLPVGGSFTVTAKTAGTYDYHCNIHPYMHGEIVVQP